MKNILLTHLLSEIDFNVSIGSTEREIAHVRTDSRKVSEGDAFIAIEGVNLNGHSFIPKAIKAGAKVIIAHKKPRKLLDHITYIFVDNTKRTLYQILNYYYQAPQNKLQIIGVTGTNGKTSVVTFLYNLFNDLGYPSGLISTIENRVGKQVIKGTHTTPDIIQLYALLAEMVKEGCHYCFMEASSHALEQDRVMGIDFKAAVFTNLTRDHMDYHKNFSSYMNAKKKLFDKLSENALAVLNRDDKYSNIMCQNTKAKQVYYSVKSKADYEARVITHNMDGLHLQLGNELGNKELHLNILGSFNAYNILATYALASHLLSIDDEKLIKAISHLPAVKGRFEHFISKKGVCVVIDYAHTPNALENILSDIKESSRQMGLNSRIITVIGCGGDRDKGKRALMGQAVAAYSDLMVLTSDNPRNEDPETIIQHILAGMSRESRVNVLSEVHRKKAIEKAYEIAQKNDFILIAGKGHETVQIIGDEEIPFDDKLVAQQICL